MSLTTGLDQFRRGRAGFIAQAGTAQAMSHGTAPAAGVSTQALIVAPPAAGPSDPIGAQVGAVSEGTDTSDNSILANPEHLAALGRTRPPRVVSRAQLKRDITAGVSLPKQIDQLMTEHVEFLYRQGAMGSRVRFPESCNGLFNSFSFPHF